MSLKGGCLCGVIGFEVQAFMPQAANCHCSMCRKFHGTGFAPIGSVEREHFSWLHGEDELKSYTAANGTVRSFCRHCGSSLLFASPRAPGIIEVALGAMSDDLEIKPDANIFVGSKANWCEPQHGLPNYAAGRNSPVVK